jgi:hypothetical protein
MIQGRAESASFAKENAFSFVAAIVARDHDGFWVHPGHPWEGGDEGIAMGIGSSWPGEASFTRGEAVPKAMGIGSP